MKRYQIGRAATLTHTFETDDEAVLPAASVTVTVLNADDAQVASGAATPVSDSWSFTLPLASLDANTGVLSVVWSAFDAGGVLLGRDTVLVEVVGGVLFTVRDARNSDSELAIASEYPGSEIASYRDVIAEEFETITGRSFVRRTRDVVVETDGSDAQWTGLFDVAALNAAVDVYTALPVDGLAVDANGVLSGLSALPEGTVVRVRVTYGFAAVPEDVKRAAMIRLRYLLAAESSGVPDRATSYVAAEGGTFTLATAGRSGYKTGIPDVDAVLALYSRNVLRDVLAVG